MVGARFRPHEVGAGEIEGVFDDEDFRDLAFSLLLRASCDVGVVAETVFLSGFHRHPPGEQLAVLVEKPRFRGIGQCAIHNALS